MPTLIDPPTPRPAGHPSTHPAARRRRRPILAPIGCAVLLAVGPCDPPPSPPVYSGEYTWSSGAPSVRLPDTRNSLCFLTGMSGYFLGGGEEVSLIVRDDRWWLVGTAHQPISVRAKCVTWNAFRGISGPRSMPVPVVPGGPGLQITSTSGNPVQHPENGANLFCMLNLVGGYFRGGGEQVQVWAPPESGLWELGALSLNADPVTGGRKCISFGGSGNVRITGHYHWRQGRPPVSMQPKATSLCFLAGVGGAFRGDGEAVWVRESGDTWTLGGSSGGRSNEVNAYAYCVAYDQTGPPSPRPALAGCFPGQKFQFCRTCGGNLYYHDVTMAGCNREQARHGARSGGCQVADGPCPAPSTVSACQGGVLVYAEFCCKATGTTYAGLGCSAEQARQRAQLFHLNCELTPGICGFSFRGRVPLLSSVAAVSAGCPARSSFAF